MKTFQKHLLFPFLRNFRADERSAIARTDAATRLMVILLARAWDLVFMSRSILGFAGVGVIEELHNNNADVWKESSRYCEDRISNLSGTTK